MRTVLRARGNVVLRLLSLQKFIRKSVGEFSLFGSIYPSNPHVTILHLRKWKPKSCLQKLWLRSWPRSWPSPWPLAPGCPRPGIDPAIVCSVCFSPPPRPFVVAGIGNEIKRRRCGAGLPETPLGEEEYRRRGAGAVRQGGWAARRLGPRSTRRPPLGPARPDHRAASTVCAAEGRFPPGTGPSLCAAAVWRGP